MLINPSAPRDWRELQSDTGQILSECGLEVEINKTITTARGEVEVDVYAKDSMKKASGRGEKMDVGSTDYCLYHSNKLIEMGMKTKDLAVSKAKDLLGVKFREVYSL